MSATFESSIRTVDAGAAEEVQQYYGKVLSNSDDLKTTACMTSARPEEYVVEALKYS